MSFVPKVKEDSRVKIKIQNYYIFHTSWSGTDLSKQVKHCGNHIAMEGYFKNRT